MEIEIACAKSLSNTMKFTEGSHYPLIIEKGIFKVMNNNSSYNSFTKADFNRLFEKQNDRVLKTSSSMEL